MLGGTKLIWNSYFGLWAMGLLIWDQKWGLLAGLALGGLAGYHLHP